MTDRPHLPNAPVIEALVDLRVEPAPTLVTADLRKVQDLLGHETFPTVQPQSFITSRLQLLPEKPPVAESSHVERGFLFRSADQLRVVQAQRDGYSYSRLRPYTNWADLIRGSRECWAHYVDVAKPRRVSRVAVRFINRVEIPLPTGDLRQWFPFFPDLPPKLPQSISEMFMRFVVPVPTIAAVAIMTQAIEPFALGDVHAKILFDVDIARPVDFDPTDPVAIWNAIESMKDVKNDFFYEHLSTKTLELFK